ncbi:MAG: NAD-dependent epimerase/dehydratase family protein [Acidobacteria bacterium]|nr:NAD-dependent epimerase/dehydratase family protein [Acidobacteriota bacterium]NIM62647.1 NAD-dependent epimerase/dehydratase family protein [Acidobacteriota bacterium]NIO59887.1 NAD-dependent epimerase/dehydratase family protein [Acidobacteriota bacterium]NIQ86061.1 NAD-dependent epimerase/dehydratase family protein [Acidobacteriota bacterium]NIT11577.1 NAD-dependent epimerase/dehydratase family protein [Acidobacteriota bacterium]
MRVLVTGAGGFVGSRLAAALGPETFGLVRRDPGTVPWRPVRGDLLEPDGWRASLAGVSTVVHLAALTGKARAEEHRRINVEGTRRLIDACKRAGVERLVFVSSIAAGFEDLRRYPYGQAKREAEGFVRDSGLAHVIVRPTMILGPGSPNLEKLRRIATLPIMPIFGTGRTLVQPVHVDDVVLRLLQLVESPPERGALVSIGGPEAVSIEVLLERIRIVERGSSGPKIRLPMGLMLPLLAVGETIAFGAMPFTTGQVATFRFDSTVPDDAAWRDPPLLSIDAMIGAEATS